MISISVRNSAFGNYWPGDGLKPELKSHFQYQKVDHKNKTKNINLTNKNGYDMESLGLFLCYIGSLQTPWTQSGMTISFGFPFGNFILLF